MSENTINNDTTKAFIEAAQQLANSAEQPVCIFVNSDGALDYDIKGSLPATTMCLEILSPKSSWR